jgi:transposase InsO family protein
MPWKESTRLEQRLEFVLEAKKAELSFAELCRTYGISRPTGYELVRRYEQEGPAGLVDRSRAPHDSPHALSEAAEGAILELREKHPRWGPRKLRSWLAEHKPRTNWPATSTIGELLRRSGLTVPAKRRRRTPVSEQPFGACDQCNAVWCIDFKGWFRTGDGERCNPLTLTDAYSRYLLRCQVLEQPDGERVKPILETAFREYGLPQAIRSDNGAPFASRGLAGLSRLSIWWIKLGIVPERIVPGKPQQNGRHERMHLTLLQETIQPPARTLRGQQQRFDAFRAEFNNERPHEALSMKTPGSIYQASGRPFPVRLPEIEYPQFQTVRKVHERGAIFWKHQPIFVSETLAGEHVALAPIDERYWKVFFAQLELGVFDAHCLTFRPAAAGRKRRRKTEPDTSPGADGL